MAGNYLITEANTITEAIYPQTGVSVSSSTLVDMRDFRRFLTVAQHGTATTASAFNIRIYESTASTWGGAVAVLLAQKTVTVATASTALETLEISVDDITEGKRFLGVFLTKVDTASSLASSTIRSNDRYLG
jgi:hypothetical protein